MNFRNDEFDYNQSSNNNRYIHNYTNNILQISNEPKNNSCLNVSNNELRKIKEEISNLKDELNYYKGADSKNIESLKNQINMSKYNFVDKKFFQQKLEEIDSKISINSNTNQLDLKVIKNMMYEINKLKYEINNIKNNNNNLFINSNRFNLSQNIKPKESIDNINNINEIKLKDIIDKNSFLRKEFDILKKEMNSFKELCNSAIMGNSKTINELEFKYENLKNDDSSNKLNDFKEINKIKDDINKIKSKINEIKITNETNIMNFSNKNIEMKIYEILEKLNLTKLSDFNMDKYNIICKSYENLTKNYINISKIVERQNNNIKILNDKLNEVSYLVKKQPNKEIIKIEDNNIFQKKYEILERQMEYIQKRVEKISLDNMNVKDANIDYEKRKEELLSMKQEINNVSKQMAIYNAFIEDNNKKRDEINLRIDEIKKELKEEKNINVENKININQNINEIKSIKEKINKIEEKNKILEDTIIKLDEEKLKKLENEIIRMDEKVSSSIEEGKKIDELRNEINENNIRNNDERIKYIENELNKIRDNMKNINFEKQGDNIGEEKIKSIEEQIKKLNDDKKNQALISEELENKVVTNANKFEERTKKLELKIDNIQKEIEELKVKQLNTPGISQNKIDENENRMEENKEEKKGEGREEKKEEEREKKKEEIKISKNEGNNEEGKKNIRNPQNFGVPIDNQEDGKNEENEFDDYENEDA